MEFITFYLNVLANVPFFTVIASLVIAALAIHIVAPIVCQIITAFYDYWNRSEEGTNWYLQKIIKIRKGYIVKDGNRVWDFGDDRWWSKPWSSSIVSKRKATKFVENYNKTHASDPAYTEETVRHEGCELTHWACAAALIVSRGFLAILVAMALDYMMIKQFTVLVVILAIIAGIFVILRGGRALFDIRKKVDLIESKVK